MFFLMCTLHLVPFENIKFQPLLQLPQYWLQPTADCQQNPYDAVQDQPYISVPKTSEFWSGPRVVKMVLNTQCYLYLWPTMCFIQKKSKETLKKSKLPVLVYKFGSRAQKSPKIPKKNDHLIAICSIFLKVLYILDGTWWILMSRRFRICVPEGVWGV